MFNDITIWWLCWPQHWIYNMFLLKCSNNQGPMSGSIVILKNKIVGWETGQSSDFSMSMYFCAFMLPSTTHNVPTAFQVIHAQIMRLTLTGGSGHKKSGIQSSPGRLHTYTRLLSPIMTLHSSVNITLSHSPSTLHNLFPLAHDTRFLRLSLRIRIFFDN